MSAATEFYKGYQEAVARRKTDLVEWVERLKHGNIKAAHPDDGWVNRDKNTVHLEYPYFKHSIGVGDKIALGTPTKYRIVVVNSVTKSVFGGMVYYNFVEE